MIGTSVVPFGVIDLGDYWCFGTQHCDRFGGHHQPKTVEEAAGLCAASEWVQGCMFALLRRPRAGSVVVPYTQVAIVRGDQFNARAASNGQYAIVMLRRSSLTILSDLFARMAFTHGVFEEVGDDLACELDRPTLRGPVKHLSHLDSWLSFHGLPEPPYRCSGSERRQELSFDLLASAVRWLAAHEMAHIVNGHVAWKALRQRAPSDESAQAELKEAQGTLEWDADAFVVSQLFYQILSDTASSVEQIAGRLWTCAFAGLSLHLYCSSASGRTPDAPLPPHERIESVGQLMFEWIEKRASPAQAPILYATVRRAMHGVFHAFRSVFTHVFTEEFNWIPRELKRFEDYKISVMASQRRHHRTWSWLYPQLRALACWDGLVPPTIRRLSP